VARYGAARSFVETADAAAESRLAAVELTVPLPGASRPEDVFSFALFSAADVGKPDAHARLDRLLCAQGGSGNTAVVLLAAGAGGKKDNIALQELQFR